MRSRLRRPAWRRLHGVRLTCALALFMSSFAPCGGVNAVDADEASILNEDHNHHRLDLRSDSIEVSDILPDEGMEPASLNQDVIQYEADFIGADSGILGGRALQGHTALVNNAPHNSNIVAGDLIMYEFEEVTLMGPYGTPGVGLPSVPFRNASTRSQLTQGVASLDEDASENLEPRQDSNTPRAVYISINTCLQPTPNSTLSGDMPQLTLYVSTSLTNTNPGPQKDPSLQEMIPLDQGYAATKVATNSPVYLSVLAPNSTAMTGDWNYEIATSIDDYYHGYNAFQQPGQDLPLLLTVDTDANSALLVTQNFTNASSSADLNEKWISNGNPFTLFGFPAKNSSLFDGIRKSYCGLSMASNSLKVNSINTITTRGLGGLPKGQFYLQNLQSDTQYVAMMAMNGNSTASGNDVIGGGGTVWPNISLATNPANSSCSLLFDLPFCDQVAYSVPSNPNLSLEDITAIYDNQTRTIYQNFNYSMQQIPCNTTDSARYSLAAGCDNCTAAYKDWLCAVSIPRCEDLSLSALQTVIDDPTHVSTVIGSKALMPRNLGQPFPNGTNLLETQGSMFNQTSYSNLTARLYAKSSRNPIIDQEIQPGPYMEFLPCDDLCFSLVRMCPASMGFACPKGNGLWRSYGKQGQCNSPGSVFVQSFGTRIGARWNILVFTVLGAVLHALL